jgi:hypothetical protein
MLEKNEELIMGDAVVNGQTTKDGIIWFIHLFKEPSTQCHWIDLYSFLSIHELQARNSGGEYTEVANPLHSLAKNFNFDHFQRQNQMLDYGTLEPD